MHPETMRIVAAQRAEELRTAAREPGLIGPGRTGRSAGWLAGASSGLAAAIRRRYARSGLRPDHTEEMLGDVPRPGVAPG
jgi:hypothetical protein